MDLLAFAIAGSLVSLLAMAGGFVWLGFRRELEVTRTPLRQVDDTSEGPKHGRLAWFRGLVTGVGFYAEKPTSEIIALLAAGRWGEGLPWATPALGALAAFFFWPLLIGTILGLRGLVLFVLVAVFFIGALAAAWPRTNR